MLISIIIPVYQTEALLPRTLDSIKEQSYSSIEVVIISDGATQLCDQIVEEYREFLNISYVQLPENKGRLIARIEGIKAAKGEYIAFCDADDYLEPEMLQRMQEVAEETSADIVHCKARIVQQDQRKEIWYSHLPVFMELEGSEILERFLDNQIIWSLWDKLFSREVLARVVQELPYIRQQLNEDLMISCAAFYYAELYASVNEPLYNYVIREKAITSQKDYRNLPDIARSLVFVKSFLSERAGLQFRDFPLYDHTSMWFARFLHHVPEEEKEELFNQVYDIYGQDHWYELLDSLEKYITWYIENIEKSNAYKVGSGIKALYYKVFPVEWIRKNFHVE